MSGYVKILKVKGEDKDKSNKVMSFRIDYENLLEKYKAIWTKIDDFKNFESNALPVYDDRYIKTKIRSYRDQFYTNFRDLNVSENDIGCKSFRVISIHSLLVYKNKYYLQVYLGNCAYKIASKQMTDYLVKPFWRLDIESC